MANMDIYNEFREVPQEAKKTIAAGKLKGFTDVNPMWRIKKLTEIFGPCGFGWYTEITKNWIEKGQDRKEAAFIEINLYVKKDDEWSKPIVGVGGSMFTNIFKGSPETSDEAFKMAYTDAISIACKALGMAADVYFEKDRTKYSVSEEIPQKQDRPKEPEHNSPAPPTMVKEIVDYFKDREGLIETLVHYGVDTVEELSVKQATAIINRIHAKRKLDGK